MSPSAPPTAALPDIVDLATLGAHVGACRRTLRRWKSRGLPLAKCGRKYLATKESVLKWIESQASSPPPPALRRLRRVPKVTR